MKRKGAKGFRFFILLLAGSICFLAISLGSRTWQEKEIFTALVSLGELSYDKSFLDTAAKIKGLRELKPVAEIPVKLRIDDYTMEGVFLGIDTADMDCFNGSSKALHSNTPFLVLGREALASMKDSNGHTVSPLQQEKYFRMGENLNIQYSVLCESLPADPAGTSMAAADGGGAEEEWLPCRVVGVGSQDPSAIYIPLSQARNLCAKNGIPCSITKVFLKVQGKENLEKAKAYILDSSLSLTADAA